MIPAPTYSQGEIVVINFPFTDISGTKKRPALILSNDTINQTGDYLLAMITSQAKRDGLSVSISSADFTATPLPLTSFIRIHKVFLLNELLISHRFLAVTDAFRQRIANVLFDLIQ